LRILTVIESLGRGGAEQALVNVLPAITKMGHACEVAALWPPYDLAEDLEAAGIAVHRLDVEKRWNLPAAVKKVAALCRGPYDVVHAHLYLASAAVALTRPLARRPARVVTFHSLNYVAYPPTSVWQKARRAFECWSTATLMDGRTAVSDAVARHYHEHCRLSDVAVIPNSFRLERLQPDSELDRVALRSAYGVSADEVVLLSCGRMIPQKGYEYLLAALEVLAARDVRPKVLIVGDGPLRRRFVKSVAHRGLDGQVLIVPSLPHGELMKLMQAVDAVVMASTCEGLPLVHAEALAVGAPVVATDVGGVPEIITHGESGWLVPPRDPVALAAGIEHVLNTRELRARLRERGRRVIEERFATQPVAERLLGFYQSVLDARRGG
jgi:glycosyltransferase involved in cell wall biosynthesis